MANTFYAKQTKTTTASFIADLARFLINDLTSFSGPSWTIVDTYSSAAGTPHEVPGDATDMDSLAADNGWRTGTLAVNDYIILESSSASNTFQVGIEYQSTTIVRVILAPKKGFVTANDDADMTTAGNWGQTRCTTTDFTTINSSSNYSVIGSPDRFVMFFEQDPSYSWMYCGKLADAHSADTYSSIILNSTGTANLRFLYTDTYWRRLSIPDTTAEITCSTLMYYDTTGFVDTQNHAKESNSSEYRLMPVYITCPTSGKIGVFGRLDGVYMTNGNLVITGKGTLGSKAYAFMGTGAGSYSPICFDWDSTTTI